MFHVPIAQSSIRRELYTLTVGVCFVQVATLHWIIREKVRLTDNDDNLALHVMMAFNSTSQ
jgi:hypothetical protein